MDFSWGYGCGTSWFFSLACLIFMVAMMLMMFRRGGCMPTGRRPGAQPDGAQETPRQLLDRRLASGQITREQYDAIRKDLEFS